MAHPDETTPLATLSDEQLVAAAREGCQASLDELLGRFQMPVLHFLRQRGAGSDTEDLLQETYVRVFTNLDRYQPRWRFATWVFTIARRVSINHHRRKRPTTGDAAIEGAESNAPDPHDAMVGEENRESIWSLAADVLSEEELTAVWLYYVEETPHREIAGVLDRSCAAIKQLMFRARKKLMPLLRRFEPARQLAATGQEKTPAIASAVTEASHG